jgi:c-di-GMP-binding flagellar brake protein YcgR
MSAHNISATTSKAKQPQNLLYRSRIEICRILQSLERDICEIHAEIGNSDMFVSHILQVNTCKNYFVISYGKNKLLNSELLKLQSLKFTTVSHDAQLLFEVFNPSEVLLEGRHAVRFDLPKTIIIHHRRDQPRIPIPAEASLRCVADDAGFVPFESHICDISHDGLGCILYDRGIKLNPGVVLKGCRIIIPKGNAIVADLKLCHIEMITFPDGTLGYQAGFQFIQMQDGVTELINYFIQDLDKS